MEKGLFWLVCLCGLFFLLFNIAGCSIMGAPPSSASGFIRKEFLRYERAAVLPFKGDTGEASYIFAEDFHEKFPQIELVRREEVFTVLQEQDLYSDWIDDAARRRIGEALGVQALITGDVYYPSVLRWLLQIQVIDVGTGEIIGRSLVEIDYAGSLGVGWASRIAVENLAPR
jgi:hypothetical protein